MCLDKAISNMTCALAPQNPEVEEAQVLASRLEENDTRRTVVKRDDDVLTEEEKNARWPEITEPMLKELKTWATLKCFSRKQRSQARNIIDVRWVLKWKWEEQAQDAQATKNSAAEAKKVIRARLTVRGFKDVDKWSSDTYAGTSSRCSQKILVSEAARQKWPICTADISKAFLQGVTYKELSEITGEPLREVNFTLPRYNIAQLCQIPGFETFNPDKEV
jgi:hypothetical protein